MITLLFIYFVAESAPSPHHVCLRDLQAAGLFVLEFNEVTQKPPSLPPTVGRQRSPQLPAWWGCSCLTHPPQLRLPSLLPRPTQLTTNEENGLAFIVLTCLKVSTKHVSRQKKELKER